MDPVVVVRVVGQVAVVVAVVASAAAVAAPPVVAADGVLARGAALVMHLLVGGVHLGEMNSLQ